MNIGSKIKILIVCGVMVAGITTTSIRAEETEHGRNNGDVHLVAETGGGISNEGAKGKSGRTASGKGTIGEVPDEDTTTGERSVEKQFNPIRPIKAFDTIIPVEVTYDKATNDEHQGSEDTSGVEKSQGEDASSGGTYELPDDGSAELGDGISDLGEYEYTGEDSGYSEGTNSGGEGTERYDGDNDEPDDAVTDDGGWTYYCTARITFYDAGPCCCGEWAYGPTASGAMPTVGRTVAAGYDLPFGTEVLIDGQVYVVEDRGVDTGCFDIFVSDHETALALGMYYTDVYVR